jgi:hypothetical protein
LWIIGRKGCENQSQHRHNILVDDFYGLGAIIPLVEGFALTYSSTSDLYLRASS